MSVTAAIHYRPGGSFAFVMAAGILSIDAERQGFRRLALALLAISAIAFVLLSVATWWIPLLLALTAWATQSRRFRKRLRATVLAAAVLIVMIVAVSSAMAQSVSDTDGVSTVTLAAPPIHKPINLEIEAPSNDFTKDIAKTLNDIYDKYLSFKKELDTNYGVQYSMPVSVFPQWGQPNGGPGIVSMVYTPNITWTPFTKTAFGSGLFTFQMQQTQFWSSASGESLQSKLGLITSPSVQPINLREYNQIMYTHTFPDGWNWLSVTIGQYGFAAYDSNQYAGNSQTNFISGPLAGNATQTYPNGGHGAYAQAQTPDQQFTFAAGFQNASNAAAPRCGGARRRPAGTPISPPESGRRSFSAAGATNSSVTASPRCHSSQAVARARLSTRRRISTRNGGSSCVPTLRAEP
jgi:hypothetical protein